MNSFQLLGSVFLCIAWFSQPNYRRNIKKDLEVWKFSRWLWGKKKKELMNFSHCAPCCSASFKIVTSNIHTGISQIYEYRNIFSASVILSCVYACLDAHEKLQAEHRELRVEYYTLKEQMDDLNQKMKFFTKVSFVLCASFLNISLGSLFLAIHSYLSSSMSCPSSKLFCCKDIMLYILK